MPSLLLPTVQPADESFSKSTYPHATFPFQSNQRPLLTLKPTQQLTPSLCPATPLQEPPTQPVPSHSLHHFSSLSDVVHLSLKPGMPSLACLCVQIFSVLGGPLNRHLPQDPSPAAPDTEETSFQSWMDIGITWALYKLLSRGGILRYPGYIIGLGATPGPWMSLRCSRS